MGFDAGVEDGDRRRSRSGVIESYAVSQPICGRAHWSPYAGSSGAPWTSRTRSASTRVTDSSARSAWAPVSVSETAYSRSAGIDVETTASAAARVLSLASGATPLANATR